MSKSLIKLGHEPDTGTSPFTNPIKVAEEDLADFKTFVPLDELNKPKEVVIVKPNAPVIPEAVVEIANKSNPTPIIIIVVLILLIAGFGAFYFNKKKKS